MPDHRIRLRGGWEWHDPSAPADAPRRVALPIAWPADATRRVRLVRHFNDPPLDPARESLWLELEQVGGLVAVVLNGRELALPAWPTGPLVLPLSDPTTRRNTLVLEVDPPRAGGVGGPWGHVALLIRPAAAGGDDRGDPLGGRDHPV